MRVLAALTLAAVSVAHDSCRYKSDDDAVVVFDVPKWKPTYNMTQSTVVMPCNESGFADPELFSRFGISDFDWSNAKVEWSNAKPMDCEERLVTQASMVKAVNPTARVFVYRNLVKALPWYTSVREKITDPAYSGWFLPFSKKPSNGTKWHMSKCTGSKCSNLYHDQEQTPHAPGSTAPTAPTRTKLSDGWYLYNSTNDVSGCHPGWETIVQGTPQPDWQSCKAAAEQLGKKGFTWWDDPTKPAEKPFCWCLDQWAGHTPQNNTRPGGQPNHVSGYKPSAGEAPPPVVGHGGSQLCASGECDCGEGFPCGEYLWDHRNQSLRTWLIREFILGKKTGLGNSNVDGFYLDDGWSNTPAKIPPWAPPSYAQCSMSPVGGATEEDFYCTADMGLTQRDVDAIRGTPTPPIQCTSPSTLSSAQCKETWTLNTAYVVDVCVLGCVVHGM